MAKRLTETRRKLSTASRKARTLAAISRVPRYRHAYRLGTAATVEHANVSFRHDFATVLDVGAHQGQFAIFARERFPRAIVHSFEPLSEARTTLERQAAADPRLRVHPFALSDRAGRATMHVSARDDSSSLLPLTARQSSIFPGTQEASTAEVEMRTLDELREGLEIQSPCLLKVDVQGAELRVLDGAREVLDRVDEVFIECSFVELYEGQALAWQVVDKLGGAGFAVDSVCPSAQTDGGQLVQADFLFVREAPAPSHQV